MFSNIQLSIPSSDLFKFLPSSIPEALPPVSGSTPFSIPVEFYRRTLDYRVPLTVAALYGISVFFVNSYNLRHGSKPWAISKTKIFSNFVILHNMSLAVYSGWTFLGMWGTLQRSVLSPYSHDGPEGMVDSLCKIHGSQGLGRSLIYNTSISKWVFQSSPNIKTATDLQLFGRLWNEGLAFYGWLFYLSKFYEVLDTFIILAKGRPSSILQTYHHAGAMLCMWSGIRFMSPPIWMFVFINSGIHTLMYLYYTLSTFHVSVPRLWKKSLTSLQILQFLVGSFYASMHSFISYSYLVTIPNVNSAFQNDTVSTTTSSVVSLPSPKSIHEKINMFLIASILRPKMVYPDSNSAKTLNFVKLRTKKIIVPCLDSSGQNFAVWLNVIYLIPLTILFVAFFAKSYFPRSIKIHRRSDTEAKEIIRLNEESLENRKVE